MDLISVYESELRVYDPQGNVERIKGADRYKTSIKVAEMIYENQAPTYAVIAYSQNYPDGLCGGPLAYFVDAPLILTRPLMKNGQPVKSEVATTIDARNY